jgi:hypothetical protein
MMGPDQTRSAAAATFFGSVTADKAAIAYTAGAVLSVADRPEFFAKLRLGQCTFDDDTRQSGFVEVANRRVFFTANAGVLSIRATDEVMLGGSTSTLIAGAARCEPARQAAIEAATEAQQRWVKPRD